jgi:hypothetical protein
MRSRIEKLRPSFLLQSRFPNKSHFGVPRFLQVIPHTTMVVFALVNNATAGGYFIASDRASMGW